MAKLPDPKSSIQRLILAIVPRKWRISMIEESQRWMLVCPCGHMRSFWDIGGIRWKAKGNPRKLLRCPSCAKATWHTVSWREEAGLTHPDS